MSSNILKADNGVSSGTTGLVYTAGNDGTLQLATTTSGGTATTAITIDNSQNVGVGVTPSAWTASSNTKALQFVYGSVSTSTNNITMVQNGYYNGSNWIYLYNNSSTLYNQGSGVHSWYNAPSGTAGNPISGANAFVQAMTLDNSGNLLVGTTTTGGSNSNSNSLDSRGWIYTSHLNGSASGTGYAYYNYNGSNIGSITQNGTTGVLFNTTSDYRLKSNVQPVTSGLSVINQLNPVNFTWISDNEADTGFLAHEFQAVIPRSVTGEKDATKTEEYEITPAVKDENGNVTTPAVMGTRTVPVYQQMDNSGAVPYLVAAIKELSAEVTALKAKIGV
jgi:hypothetical protein